jgi:tetratricopeptide (TPR) repeat protein
VAGAIEPSLQLAEAERARARPTESLGAYDLYLRALPQRWLGTREASGEALRLLRRALALDGGFASALGALAGLIVIRVSQGWAEEGEIEEGLRCARELVEQGGADNPSALAWGAYALSYLAKDHGAGLAAAERAHLLAPNSAPVLFLSGWSQIYAGDWRTAIERVNRAMRLSPVDPLIFYFLAALSGAHFVGEGYGEAAEYARRALHRRPTYLTAHRLLAASLAQLGRLDAASEAIRALLAVAPADRLSEVAARSALRGAARERYLDGLRRAGLPE